MPVPTKPPALPPEPWTELRAELDRWAALGRRASFWWRDDDAVAPSPALDRLLALAARHGRWVALAVIPDGTGPALAERLAGTPTVAIQHGWAHRSHAPAGEKTAELGDHRPAEAVLAELSAGRDKLQALFGDRFRPVLAPPWNRIGPQLRARLGEAGLLVLSGFGARDAAPGPAQVNTHADPVDWRGGRGFAGIDRTLAPILRHLADRRVGAADPEEPTGILTHHLVHDDEGWIFLDGLFSLLSRHPAAAWPDADSLFGARR
ncbi:polysaccharide deacetylase family protein [Inquilinus limosus]|uniref:polysaccharide deacetylase family protein n=1 Tax=Inquilinus limosus TaxID=171674 RepID=UPI000687D117|nr:polysaccharide deacetylase family protein [Inquilinus limosus]